MYQQYFPSFDRSSTDNAFSQVAKKEKCCPALFEKYHYNKVKCQLPHFEGC